MSVEWHALQVISNGAFCDFMSWPEQQLATVRTATANFRIDPLIRFNHFSVASQPRLSDRTIARRIVCAVAN